MKVFYYHLKDKHNLSTINWKDESLVTNEIFDKYRVSIYDPFAPTKPGFSTVLNQNITATQVPQDKPVKSLASEFRRGIKREKICIFCIEGQTHLE